MSDTQRTPVPWTLVKPHTYGNPTAEITGMVGNDRFVIARTSDMANDEANAEFIVRACNCHDALLAGCKWIMLMDDDGLLAGGPTTNRGLAAVRAAIAKVEP